VPDLNELPDHHCLEHCPDAAGHHYKCIRHQHKLVKSVKKSRVLICLANKAFTSREVAHECRPSGCEHAGPRASYLHWLPPLVAVHRR
jgi:hypothetical protein